MNEALQRWREDFAREPDTAFDRLVRGLVPLGGASQLSFGEILDALFEPGDTTLDGASAAWLGRHILGPLPENTSLHRWAAILEEYFRGIAPMELPQTGEILRRQHKRLRLWLHGFYEGSDRDPEGAYLLALARAQDSQHFSPLWRRLILGEELAGRPYLGIGILGFRKMPAQNGRESSGVPEGLLQALVELADKQDSGIGQTKWKQTMRSLFATYRRNENFWVERLAPIIPHHEEESYAREWLSDLLRGIPRWRPNTAEARAFVRHARKVPVSESLDWVQRIGRNAEVCDTDEFASFLNRHRTYAQLTGDPGLLNKTFNNVATSIVKSCSDRDAFAVSLVEEALNWQPSDPLTWTNYAKMLALAHRTGEALDVLWKARQRFPWDSFIRNELGRILRQYGDVAAAEGVFREAVSEFPSDEVCRNALAETLRAMDRIDEARTVYEQTRRDFPNDVFSRSGLADLLIDQNRPDEAELILREALRVNATNRVARGALARALLVRSAMSGDEGLRSDAVRMLQDLSYEGDQVAKSMLKELGNQTQKTLRELAAALRPALGFQPVQTAQPRKEADFAEMSVAERLGRAMIALWQAERAEDATLRDSLCAHATVLLDVPEQQIDDELVAAFVETRGLVLLASGNARRALAYFEEQIRHYGRGGWIGVRLGEQRARIQLGEPAKEADTAEPPSSQSARFALHVARVIQVLSRTPQESEVRDLLKSLYHDAAKFAARVETDAEGKQHIENGEEMLGAFMQTRWFRPAGIQSAEDLEQPDRLHAVVERVNASRTDTFDVLFNATSEVALAA